MSEEPLPSEDFATMFARQETGPTLEVGQVVKGRVIQIDAENVFVDVGGKGEAWIERAELTDAEGKLRVAVGDEVEATVVATGDEIRLSHKLRQGAQARQALAVAAQTGIPVEGKVAAVIKGGEAVTVKVLRIDTEKGRISLSLKALEGDPWAAVPGRLRERQVIRGRAARATEFGIFVELLPGVDGLLHITEIPRNRQGALREAAASGAEIIVLIVSVDTDKRRVALALAPEGAAPGQQMESSVEVGALLTGTVERLENFGVFVRLGPGQTGLVPVSELATARGTALRRAFPVGSELKVVG